MVTTAAPNLHPSSDLEPDTPLPANVDAERTILGAVLLSNEYWPEVISKLRSDDFSLDSHRKIAIAMKSLIDAGETADIVTLSNFLSEHKWITDVGGVSYLASLTEGLPLRPAIDEYIRIVRRKTILRKTMAACTSAIARCADQSEPGTAIVGDLTKQLDEIITPVRETKEAPVKTFIADVMARYQEQYRSRQAQGLPSGNAWFDAKTGGYRKGKFTIVAARPKIGKSGWGRASAVHNLKLGRKVVDFSLEMTRDELVDNMVPYVVDLPNVVVVNPERQTPSQHELVLQAYETIVDWPWYCYDGDMDIDQVCWTIDREARGGEEVLFILDHFGLVKGAKEIRQRYVENSDRLRRKLKQYPNCAMVNLFQLNPVPRDVADKRPLPEDLKESKNPLEDCFACVLLHRYLDKESLKLTKKANINLALIRGGGSPGNVDCAFNARLLRFEADAEMELEDDENYFAD